MVTSTEVLSNAVFLSPTQQFLWRLQESCQGRSPYWSQVVISLDGIVDWQVLREALCDVTQCHETLRTTFSQMSESKLPFQVVCDDIELQWQKELDLRDCTAEECGTRVNSLLTSLRSGVAGASKSPIVVAPVRISTRHSKLIMSLPSLLVDRLSLQHLATQLCQAYEERRQGKKFKLDCIQYANYAAWHEELLSDKDEQAQRSYWTNNHGFNSHPMRLGLEQSISAHPYSPSIVERRLAPGATSAITRIAGQVDASTAAFGLACWQALLSRYIGGDRLLIGVMLDGRSYAQLQDSIGLYARHVPLNISLDPSARFIDVLKQTQIQLREMRQYQDYYAPEDRQTCERYDNSPWAAPICYDFAEHGSPVASNGLTFSIDKRSHCSRRSKLELSMIQDDVGVRFELGYDATVFTAGDADAIADQLVACAEHFLEDPYQPVQQVSLTGGNGHAARAAAPVRPVPVEAERIPLFHELFEQQAKATPTNIAAVCGAENINYADLNRRADEMALRLTQSGVGPDDAVAILMERSIDLLISILGTLKAGAAYVPIDATCPLERLRFMLEDVQPRVILTQAKLQSRINDFKSQKIIVDESLPQVTARQANEVARVSPDSLAYIIYTSGSTGKPNGVMITHKNLANYLRWCVQTYGLEKGTGSVVHSPIGFDLTVTGLLAPLVVGQKVILLRESDGVDGLLEAVRSGHDYTLIKLTPTHLIALNHVLAQEQMKGKVRTLVVGGEALYRETVAPWQTNAPDTRIFNEYGPTETTVGSCVYQCGAQILGSDRIPIGTPINNTQLFVLDANLEPVPSGIIGELFIGGDGLARGYLNSEELNKTKFIQGPDGRRIYRTGDMVRLCGDGNLEYLGRMDRQVKIRGFRIELGEIESALISHPDVRDAAVKVHEPTPGEKRLAAYYVPGNEQLTQQALKEFLHSRLPSYMVPAHFVPMTRIPTTSNGKHDQSALPAPDLAETQRTQYVPPRTPDEETLTAVWGSVFALDQVGIDDNYFVMGGDSLRSVQVSALAKKRGVDFSVAQLHQFPTVRQLAAEVRKATHAVEEVPHTECFSLISGADRAKMTDDIEDAYPLCLLQEGMIYHREFALKSAVYHAICSYRIRARFDLQIMKDVIDALVRRHPLLRTSFDLTTYSRPLQIVHKSFKDPFSYEDLRGATPEQQNAAVDGWFEEEKKRGFDLDECPLIRYKCHSLGDDVFQLTYSFHHEIIDGWSDAFMVTELLNDYFSRLQGAPFTFHKGITTFRDAIAMEQKALATEEFKQFWIKSLEGAQLMKLPRLISRPKADKGEREILKFEVPITKDLSDRIKALARELGVPLKTVLLAAHLRVMSLLGGGSDVTTYTVSNGRPDNRDSDRVIGLFVNSLAFRMKLPGGTWRDLILGALKTETELLPYRRYPMAEIKRQHGSEPLSETLFFFNYYHMADVLKRWTDAELLGIKVYGESTFPFCTNAYLAPVTHDLGMRIEYDSLQYSKELMDGMRDQYVEVLTSMVNDPNTRYENHNLLSSREKQQILLHLNQTQTPEPTATAIHRIFEQQVKKNPDACAIVFEQTCLTYRELNRCANRLARHLRSCGVGREGRVGICMERSPEMFIAVLAILKAGGAYVPLDPAHPPQRLANLVNDSDMVLVLTKSDIPSWANQKRVVQVDVDAAEINNQSAANLSDQDDPDRLAYVIYTSGSTGKPKGVMVTHRNLMQSTAARLHFYEQPVQKFLLLSSLAFDSSVAGIFWTLCSGGILVVPNEQVQSDLSAITRLAVDGQISHLLTIPSLYATVLEQATEHPESLAAVIVAGEECPKDLYECHRQTLPQTAFYNEYGPTEATVWSTVCKGHSRPLGTHVPIGRPIANTRIYILDCFGQPVPIGVAGEIYIAGGGVARGYLAQSLMTADRFLPDPFNNEAGARLYRTGDLARYLPDGNIEFLNRVDHQVKIRGFRIECGEIETVLDAHPSVQRSVVQARRDSTGEQRLIGYILPKPGATVTPEDFLKYGKDKLPKYMLPSAYVILTELPLTDNQKINRQKLPAPPEKSDSAADRVGARTPTEEVLVGIWGRVLGVGACGVHDDFFEIGGDSLRAMRIMAQIRKIFRVQIPMRSLFQHATIAGLADAIDSARGDVGTVSAGSQAREFVEGAV
jgi:amino acid adenylation domain-containing protein